jgi:F0F1-type ATP synthase membrane subunit b/b'
MSLIHLSRLFLIALLVCSFFLVSACSKKEETKSEKVEREIADVIEDAQGASKEIADEAEEVNAEMLDKATDALDKARQNAEDAASVMKEKIDEMENEIELEEFPEE